ncbi:MAG: hypothetical protein ACLGIJ_07000 [Candidatus Limnocylindria bacterium]
MLAEPVDDRTTTLRDREAVMDRSMLVLQYALAVIALVAALLLATVR